MIDFSKGVVPVKKIDRSTHIGKVYYSHKYDKFYVLFNKVKYKTNAYEFDKFKILYSKPTNDNYEHWTKKEVKLDNPERYEIVSKWWSTVKDRQNVRGIIENDNFIITKII